MASEVITKLLKHILRAGSFRPLWESSLNVPPKESSLKCTRTHDGDEHGAEHGDEHVDEHGDEMVMNMVMRW